MKQIKLSQNLYTLVDDEHFEELNKFKWYARKDRKTFYATRNSNPRKLRLPQIQLHRTLFKDIPNGMEIDHIDGNGLNNQLSNLRIVTKTQNLLNKSVYKSNKSGYRGVYYNKRDKKWCATGKINKIQKNLGSFKDIESAIKARKIFEEQYYKEFIRKN